MEIPTCTNLMSLTLQNILELFWWQKKTPKTIPLNVSPIPQINPGFVVLKLKGSER